MYRGKYVFAQVMEIFHYYRFDQCVAKYHGERFVKNLSCREQFLAMAFGQLSYRESLRDTVSCLSAHRSKLYHLGFSGVIARSTLAEANEKRNWNIYWDFAQSLIAEARPLYVNDSSFSLDLKNACYAIDSTSIELCLALFSWSPYVETKGAIKLHMVLDMRGSIPAFFNMTSGKVNDVNFLDDITFESNAFYAMDRGYVDFGRLYAIHKAGAFFCNESEARYEIRAKIFKPRYGKRSAVRPNYFFDGKRDEKEISRDIATSKIL